MTLSLTPNDTCAVVPVADPHTTARATMGQSNKVQDAPKFTREHSREARLEHDLAAALAREARLREALRDVSRKFTLAEEDARISRASEQTLRAGIEDYLLWEPGKRGHAEAHRKLAALASTEVPAATTVLFKGPSTYTTACTCGSESPGWHKQDCGVYASASTGETT